jgi:hypothetical protein
MVKQMERPSWGSSEEPASRSLAQRFRARRFCNGDCSLSVLDTFLELLQKSQ